MMVALDFRAIHARHAERLQRSFGSDRSQTVGASEIGSCARKTWFAKNSWDQQNVQRDDGAEDRWGARMRGTIYENHFWEPALRNGLPTGSTLHYAGAEQRTLAREYLSATSDAVITGLTRDALSLYGIEDIETDCIVVDCKTVDPRTNLEEAKAENVFQIHVQIGLVRELTNFRPEYGVLTYTDASFWDDGKVFVIKFDPAVYAHAHARATRIMTAVEANLLRPEGVIAGGKECDYCPYTKSCGQLRSESVPTEVKSTVEPRLAREILDLARLVRDQKDKAEAAKFSSGELADQLKEKLRQAGTRKFAGDGLSISWAPLKGRPSYDMAAFKTAALAKGVDIEAFETVGEPSDRLVITSKKEKESA